MRAVKKAMKIHEVNKKNCVVWWRENLRKTVNGDWNRVIFSDEYKVILGQDTRVRV
jgi:hypothetical protein